MDGHEAHPVLCQLLLHLPIINKKLNPSKFPLIMQVIAISSSRAGNSAYLEPAIPLLKNVFKEKSLNLAFIPFATTDSEEEYFQKVKNAIGTLRLSLEVVTLKNAHDTLARCDGIVVGGGNTFKLLHDLYASDVIDLIKRRVRGGTPYIGWSAGSNILGPTISTTNDMPIIQPKSFQALGIFPFQINPHYYNESISGFNGETRDRRIEEYLSLNKEASVVAIPEGSALIVNNEKTIYQGKAPAFHFFHRMPDMGKDEIVNGQEIII